MWKLRSGTKIILLVSCSLVLIASLLAFLHQRAKAVQKKSQRAAQKQSPAPRREALKLQPNAQTTAPYGAAAKLADLKDPAIDESSGIVASRVNPGVYWTHNDSGDAPVIFAFDESGTRRGTWRISGARARDWEAISAGPGPEAGRQYLYIGDIGDNGGRRSEIIVYRFPEPVLTAGDATSTKMNPRLTQPAEAIVLHYPDGPHDSEALLVHPLTGNLYIITKQPFGSSHVYEATAPMSASEPVTLRHIAELKIPTMFGGMITDGAISPNGKLVALCDYLQGYELALDDGSSDFDSIWTQPLRTIALGSRRQGEAITYRLDGLALLATSEGSPAPLIQIVRR